ncbi:DUF1127 domain-containing protein [Paenirhodobacter populi]|uniref:DUF1127 domain-containing protein n=1 Tax=Paenirhodobacter populi TaxID=2306993 RepID=UPI000FE408CD|nr:DUF1127 domain-containing protein [Sinirhodobacter populi]RWR07606.1 DUF1127 domain-containing protein [Sinirhodobacter populi]
MALLDTSRSAAHSSFSGIFARLLDAISAWNDLRTTRNALAKLSDRELADIGLSRYEAENIGR